MFNEAEWIKLVFLLADTQAWLDELVKDALMQVPIAEKKKLARKTYYLTCSALAHILEKHYYKISRYPQSGKFTIPVPALLAHLRDAAALGPMPVAGSLNEQRVMQLEDVIGFDREGNATMQLTILTDAGGKIITAFPGSVGKCAL